MRSTENGKTWHLNNTSTHTVNFVDVQDSNASAGQEMVAYNSVDSGNNMNWDFLAPNPVNNLTAQRGAFIRDIDLSWTATGDEGSTGTLNNSTFTIQYTTVTAFAGWDPVASQPSYVTTLHISTTGVTAGSNQGYTFNNLLLETTYYFRLWTKDNVGRYSTISNSTSSLPLGAQLLVWTGSVDSAWLRAANWNPVKIPEPDDSVYLPNVATDPIIQSSETISNISIDNDGFLYVSGATFTVTGVVSSSGTLVLSSTETLNLPNGLWDVDSGSVT
jgi:hypothetical protein